MATEGLVLSDFMTTTGPYGNRVVNLDKALEAVNMGRITPAEFEQTVYTATGHYVKPLYTGNNRPIAYNFSDTPSYTNINSVNSNVSQVRRGTVKTPINTSIDAATNTVRSGKILPPSGAPSTYSYVANSIASPVLAVATGITVGKTFDSVLYNANPKFWDSIGMSTLNPETWNSLTSGIDYTDPITGTAASLMNIIFGLNPETNEITPYIDENAFAYYVSWMQNAGVFSEGGQISTDPYNTGANYPLSVSENNWINYGYGMNRRQGVAYTNAVKILFLTQSSTQGYVILASKASFKYANYTVPSIPTPPPSTLSFNFDSTQATFNGETFYYVATSFSNPRDFFPPSSNTAHASFQTLDKIALAYQMLFETTGGIEGIGTQTGATTPQNLTGDPITDLPILQQQYPQIFDNPIQQTTVNPDGTTTTRNYVPIALPENFTNTNTQPVSDTQTQTDTTLKVDEIPENLYKSLERILQQPEEEPFNPDYEPPENPPESGGGSSPNVVAPTGSASSLWKIYHPTQAQIDSFGAWLWSSDFIDQILKIFNDPMQAIIGLHKVYCTPVDAGNATIKVGYLDSEVPSAYIEQQYIEVNCGSVDLYEQFGNVFDYDGYTDIDLYLPFIGIVKLNVSDVMRSSINIKYGVDVLTGACLAMVNVMRDGNDAVLYQYSGNCAVQYPISSGSYMGIVSSIIGVAGSVAATIATGGGAAPLAIGAAGAAMNAHTNVQHSGSFSGNSGAMGGKIPYLIISRPQTRMYSEYLEMEGTPTNHYVTVGECSGYIRAKTSHIINVNATDNEIDEIQALLSDGIII